MKGGADIGSNILGLFTHLYSVNFFANTSGWVRQSVIFTVYSDILIPFSGITTLTNCRAGIVTRSNRQAH